VDSDWKCHPQDPIWDFQREDPGSVWRTPSGSPHRRIPISICGRKAKWGFPPKDRRLVENPASGQWVVYRTIKLQHIMDTEGEDVASADGAMGHRGAQLDNGRIGQCHHEAIGRWPLEQYDDETLAQDQDGTTGNRDHGHWDTGPRTSARARKLASAEACKRASTQACKSANAQACKSASLRARKRASTQARRRAMQRASAPARKQPSERSRHPRGPV
jgi:hypothetical protein